MGGVYLTIESGDIVELARRLNRWAGSLALGNALESVGAEVESQTRRRLEDERTAPDGTPWAEWSESYAQTRHSNHSLLQSTGSLIDSIRWDVSGNDVEVGVPGDIIYGATHQFGRDGIPARPFLGLSKENEQDVLAVMADWLSLQVRNI